MQTFGRLALKLQQGQSVRAHSNSNSFLIMYRLGTMSGQLISMGKPAGLLLTEENASIGRSRDCTCPMIRTYQECL
jgi:hypothetical protein